MDIYSITEPTNTTVPIVISVPHAGTYIPKDLESLFEPKMLTHLDDTDFFVDKLYSFASEMGITMIKANYHRWVIDLNRNPESKPLYNDGRVITNLVPTTDFNGNNLYKDKVPTSKDIEDRIHKYYLPYHQKIRDLINEKLDAFGKVLLFDAHSIRQIVPGIRKEPFPDLILGNNDGNTASSNIINAALEVLKSESYNVTHNTPFKGGQITRSFGQPTNGIHALQLEMTKVNYMDDTETKYHLERAEKMQSLLKEMFTSLLKELQ